MKILKLNRKISQFKRLQSLDAKTKRQEKAFLNWCFVSGCFKCTKPPIDLNNLDNYVKVRQRSEEHPSSRSTASLKWGRLFLLWPLTRDVCLILKVYFCSPPPPSPPSWVIFFPKLNLLYPWPLIDPWTWHWMFRLFASVVWIDAHWLFTLTLNV